MPRVEWPEITNLACADHLLSNTSGSMGMMGVDWEKRYRGLMQLYEKNKTPAFWTCAYCDRGNPTKILACEACGSPIGRSINNESTCENVHVIDDGIYAVNLDSSQSPTEGGVKALLY